MRIYGDNSREWMDVPRIIKPTMSENGTQTTDFTEAESTTASDLL